MMNVTQAGGLSTFVRSRAFSNFILTVVFLNAIAIGFQSYPKLDQAYSSLFRNLDVLFLTIFSIEVILKLVVDRTNYFKDGWNVFDFIVVAASLLFINSQFVSVLRILRVLRVLKTISSVRSLRRIITSLFMAVPTIGSIALLMLIILYIYGVAGAMFFAEAAPQYFGNLSRSLITLFQIATFDDWANIYRPIAEHSPFSLIYFVTFIFIVVFVILNLVVGEIVNNATNIPSEDKAKDSASDGAPHAAELSETALLRKEVRDLKQLLLEERQERMTKSG